MDDFFAHSPYDPYISSIYYEYFNNDVDHWLNFSSPRAVPMGARNLSVLCFSCLPLEVYFLFVGAYIFGKYYHAFPPESLLGKPLAFIAVEVREFVMEIGMACFAWHGVFRPGDLFRVLTRIN